MFLRFVLFRSMIIIVAAVGISVLYGISLPNFFFTSMLKINGCSNSELWIFRNNIVWETAVLSDSYIFSIFSFMWFLDSDYEKN